MKLELKHLVSYLPYDLKGIFLNSIITLSVNYFSKGTERGYDISAFLSNNIKPILFPLSSLTKEITVNGETFVPYDKIKEIYPNTPQFTDYIKGWMQYYGVMDSKCEYVCILKLFEWKIDVFGLIEAGLAEPVTEDFNPYK